MRSGDSLSKAARALVFACAVCGAAALAGCGMPAAPEAPSLKLPQPVTDLAATRTGGNVALTWTMPKRDTSKVDLKGEVTVRLCRREGAAACTAITTLQLAPGANGAFTDTLPPALAAGNLRALSYFVELVNKRRRSAGLSNAATVLAGLAPVPIGALSGELSRDGVVLRWTPGPPEPYSTQIRLRRILLTPPAPKPSQGPIATPVEPTKQDLLVPAGGERGGALDKDIRFGETYEYRAQRVTRLTVDGKEIELDGSFSPPVRVEAQDIFAPAVPVDLAAVATAGGVGAPAPGNVAAIDLSWQPDEDADLGGYAVYRREVGQPESAWLRISPAQPVVGPGFHDANVQAGHTYEYAVTAIGQNGRESARSASTQETVPEP